MIKAILSLPAWISVIRAYEKENYASAIKHYHHFRDLRKENLSHRAFYGDLLLLNRDLEGALNQYRKVIEQIESDGNYETNQNQRYIWSYCNMAVCGLTEKPEREKFKGIAIGLQPAKYLKKLLPIVH